jgi:hypothetical protein
MPTTTGHRHASHLALAELRPVIRVRCPHCSKQGTFEQGSGKDYYNGQGSGGSVFFVVRICPNPECRGVVFAIATAKGEVLELFPAERVEWDTANLPDNVSETFEEAVSAFSASCYRATALLVRRTLELVCDDQGAQGENLFARIEALGETSLVPAGLFSGLHNLRLLGNDAAHVSAKDYLSVGRDEAALALDVAKELLKAVYQYEDLVRRLEALKNVQP